MNLGNLVDGVVLETADPQEMGRIKVWCPSVDGPEETLNVNDLPWATYVSILAGQTENHPGGSSGAAGQGPASYGLWAVPRIGARVVVGFLYGDPTLRVYLGSYFPLHGNRSLPAGRNSSAGPVTDANQPIEPASTNLKAQFQGDLSNPIAKSRGAYERQVAQPLTEKTDAEGYSTRQQTASGKIKDEEATGLDPQTYCLTTPGRHAIILQDDPRFSRVRIKTADGHQVIFDDANERIYVSTAKGRTWVELDSDGHIHVYGAESISMSAGGDLNLQALGSVNISAGKNVNVNAAGYARMTACDDVSLSGGAVNLTSGAGFNILAAGQVLMSGSQVHLNGPTAPEAPCADSPSITPSHEPWSRPASAGTRNKNWRP